MDEESRQSILDAEHLRLLALGYRISAGLSALFSLLGLLYIALGVFFAAIIPKLPQGRGGPPPPAFIGILFGLIGAAFMVVSLAMAAAKFFTARCLDRRTGRTFCQVVAVISCLGIPYGTILGAFTFIVLSRPSVRELFGATRP